MAKNVQLSENFWLNEFTKKRKTDLSPQQWRMIGFLAAEVLQPIRDKLKLPITITSGERTTDDYWRLIRKGYYPSETSDHFFVRDHRMF